MYRVSAEVDVPVVALAATATAVPYLFGSGWIVHRCPCSPSEVNGLDRGVIGNHSDLAKTLSDVGVGVALGVPLILDWLDVGLGPEWLEDMTVYAETLALSGMLVAATKYAVQRPLPRVYEGDARLAAEPGGYRSFYSGHTATVMAALTSSAMTMTLRHHATWWPWLTAAIAGAGVGAGMILAGDHFYTDVAVGFAAGTSLGIVVPWLHEHPKAEARITLLPAPGGPQLALVKAL